MKMALLAAVALVAAPAFAQMTNAPGSTAPTDQSTMAPPPPAQPMQQPTPTTAPGSMPAPDSTMPMNNGSMPAATPADGAAPMPMAGGKLPWCRKGQYTACREHENKKGEGVSKM